MPPAPDVGGCFESSLREELGHVSQIAHALDTTAQGHITVLQVEQRAQRVAAVHRAWAHHLTSMCALRCVLYWRERAVVAELSLSHELALKAAPQILLPPQHCFMGG